jgi:hypothetical protein
MKGNSEVREFQSLKILADEICIFERIKRSAA